MWGYAQPYYSAVVAWGTNGLLAAEELGVRVTTLRPAGSLIEVYSTLREDGQAANDYNADLLHFYIVLSLSVVLAYPGLRAARRLRILAVTLAAILAFQVLALLVTVEHTYAVKLAEIAKRNYSPFEAKVYTWLYQSFVFLPIQLTPAAVLLILYARFGGLGRGLTGRSAGRRETPLRPAHDAGRRRRLAVRAAVAAAVVLAPPAFGAWKHLEKVRFRQSEDLCYRGWKALDSGSTEESSRLLREAARRKPAFVEAHDGLGQARLKAGNFTEAEKAFRDALAVDPNYLESLVGLASALKSLGRREEAKETFRRASETHPERFEPRWGLAVMLLEERRVAEVEPLVARVIELNPGFPDPRITMADLMGVTGRPCEALPHMEAYLRLDPGSARAAHVAKQVAGLRAFCAGGTSP